MNQPMMQQQFRPPTQMQPLAPTPMGLGEPPPISATPGVLVLGLAIAAGSAYAGYKIGEHYAPPAHKTAGKVVGAIAGWLIIPTVIGVILTAIRPAPTPVPSPISG